MLTAQHDPNKAYLVLTGLSWYLNFTFLTFQKHDDKFASF